ncbi:hypothetical protein SDRG_06182 [Saprolegnia diclina VS20]|uniref:Anaphase-promoting complex subunit 7 n=1 Tax=Saprolegnia diclina (strain VS20) TaxID=1156394 RepID=T0QPS5_SAPDV|nr:hypothetical protein SDRG_06182 [Saprolegnia diclina VS20]EQC36746.1 hypothetical protein SDRG_06182 [Saprolegnia diclina VS20]|eukprot:XP_008610167.1 hypothetical protein SDRG_06182 [Saprolegnia diclina VS20]
MLTDASLAELAGHMRALLRDGEAESVAALGSLLCSQAHGSQQRRLDDHPAIYALYADALVAKAEHKRALRYFAMYLSSTNAGEGTTVRLTMAKCYRELGDVETALQTLETIPASARTLPVYMLLGKLFRSQGQYRRAEESFAAVLKLNPYALEASLALAEVAAPMDVERKPTSKGYYDRLPPGDTEWLETLPAAHNHVIGYRLHAGLEAFASLETQFGLNVHCTLQKAKLQADLEWPDLALATFARARQLDATNLDYMDMYARLLRDAGSAPTLNNLVRDLFSISMDRPEPWLAAACYSELKTDTTAALQLVDRAIVVDPTFARSYVARGRLLLAMDRSAHAVSAFASGSRCGRSLEAYEGLVEGYCDLCLKGDDKYLDAMHAARLALLLAPMSARALVLVGSVLSLRPDRRDEARRTFEKALAANPDALRAHLGLVDLFLQDDNLAAAITTLEGLVAKTPRDVLFAKLGDVYVLKREYNVGLQHYHRALSLNSNLSSALLGLDRVEKLLRGEDPDAGLSTISALDDDMDEPELYSDVPRV